MPKKSVCPFSKLLQREGSNPPHKHTSSEKNSDEWVPPSLCSGPGFWNILYNTLLNLEFSIHTKVIAFADDLAIMMAGDTPVEAEV